MVATDVMDSFGEVLRQCRLAAGLTQEELAERAGLSERGIQDLERGLRRVPHQETARRLAEALSLTGAVRVEFEAAARYGRLTRQKGPPFPSGRNLCLASVTNLVGREQEIMDIKRLVLNARLFTLTGPGGIGKSRLAAAVASEVVPAFPDGVWLVELAGLHDPALVPQVVAAGVGVREQPNRPMSQTLVASLSTKHLLLVLDNCEHLLAACASLADTLLRGCPDVRILTTSRQILGMAGETAWHVPPLAFPDTCAQEPVEHLGQYPAVRLFAERAAAVRSGFTITNQNAAAVIEICHALDGLPLAIELAAARINVLTPGEIAGRLHDRFRLLTGGSRTAPIRHQTLRATMDWSYDLLTDSERVFLRGLSVFAGGFTLDAAEAVCAGSSVEGAEVLDLLSGLVDKSLVATDPASSGPTRYRMLETIREYAADRLTEAGEARRWRSSHLAWSLALAERSSRWTTAQMARLASEHDNLRAALRTAIDEARRVEHTSGAASGGDGGDAEAGLRLGGALWHFWFAGGHYAEGSGLLAELLAVPHAQMPAGIPALAAAGHLAFLRGNYSEAQAHLQESVVLAQLVGDPQGVARALHFQAMLVMVQGDRKLARRLVEQSLALNRQLGRQRRALNNLLLLGRVFLWDGDTARAAKHAEDSLALAKHLEDSYGIALSLDTLGRVAMHDSAHGRARLLLEQALVLARRVEHRQVMYGALVVLGRVALAEGDAHEANRLLIEALVLANEAGDSWYIADALEAIAGSVVVSEPERTVRLAGAAAGLRQRLGFTASAIDRDWIAQQLKATQTFLREARYAAAWQEGISQPLDEAVTYALTTQAPRATAGPSVAH